MTLNTKVQITFLLDLAAALPNRDQNGRAKRIPYGNAVRQRISSQCYKAALRSASYLVRYDDARGLVGDNLKDLADAFDLGMAYRSRAILSRKVRAALAEAIGDEKAIQWVEASKELFLKDKSKDTEESEPEGDDITQEESDADTASDVATPGRAKDEPGFTAQPIVLGEKEVAALVQAILVLDGEGVEPGRLKPILTKKGYKVPQLNETSVRAVECFKAMMATKDGHAVNVGIDGAFFGRFSTSDFLSNVDSAVHVAHLIGVNPISAVPDYFSVQDTILAGEVSGGSHQNNTEIASSLFLGTVVVDVTQLSLNTGIADPEGIAACVAWLVRAIHSVNPAAKLGSTAPYGNVIETVVEIGPRQPRSHIIAFQKALDPSTIRDGSLADVAARALREQVEESGRRFGAQKHVLLLSGSEPDGERPAYEVLAKAAGEAVAGDLAVA